MPGPWVTSEQLQQAVADDLHKGDRTALRSRWVAICDRSIVRGYRDIYTRLVAKGYTPAQLDAWDDRVSYTMDQALFWAFVEGSGLADYSDRDYNKLDHRKELAEESFAIMINGQVVLPGLSAMDIGGSVLGGSLTTDVGEITGPSTFRTQYDRRRRSIDLFPGEGYNGVWEE